MLTEAKVSNQPKRLSPSVNRSNPSLDSSCSSAFRISFCFLEIRESHRSLLLLSLPFIIFTGNSYSAKGKLIKVQLKCEKSNRKGYELQDGDGFVERESTRMEREGGREGGGVREPRFVSRA